jgi:peroxiredoxin
MLAIGARVPDFTLPMAHADGRKDPVHLSHLLKDGPVVLSFFPLAFTRVCTTQMCDARDSHAATDALGARVVGFSIDTVFTNVQFAKAHDLKNGIYSDANRDVVERIWETEETAGVRHVAKRGWMVVASDGTVAATYVASKPGEPWPGSKPIEEALAKLARA